MKTLLTIVLVSFLASCATQPAAPLTVHQRIEAACVSAGTAYGVIAAVNNVHSLTADQQASVLKAKALVDARCKLAPGADYPYTLSGITLSELEGAAGTLEAIKGVLK